MAEEIKKYHDLGEKTVSNNLGFLFCPSLPYQRIGDPEGGEASYDEVYNNYKVKIKQKLQFQIKKDSTGNIIDYIITVPAKWNSNNYPCLRGLTAQGRFNLDLLNSGQSQLRGWRFWNNPDNKYTKIALIFELYPREGETFEKLTIKFYDVNNTKNYSTGSTIRDLVDDDISTLPTLEREPDYTYSSSGEIYNGNNTVEINWENYLDKCKLYEAELSYISNYNGQSTSNKITGLWLLTTRLFNSCFDPGDEYVANYCHPETRTEIATIENKLKIKLKFKDIGKIPTAQTTEYSTKGSLISTSEDIDFTSIQTDKIYALSERLGLEIENQELYPDYITLSESSNLVDIQLNVKDTSEILNPIYNQLGRPLGSDKISSYLYIVDNNDGGISIISKERVIGKGTEADLQNVFVKMSEALPELLNQTTQYCGVFPDVQHDGSHYMAFVESSINNNHAANSFDHPYRDMSDNIIQNGDLYGYFLDEYHEGQAKRSLGIGAYSNSEVEISISKLNEAFNHFNENNNQSCTWMYGKNGDNNSLHYHNNPTEDDNSSRNLSQSSAYTIIWWRAIDRDNGNLTSWRACKVLTYADEFNFNSEKLSKNLVEKLFGGDFYFCFIKNTGAHSGLFIPTLNNQKFTFDETTITLTIPVKLSISKTGSNAVNGLDIGKKIGVKFTLELENDKEDNIECTIDHRNYNLNQLITGANGQREIDKIGRKVDSSGQSLNVDNIYTEQNGKLKKITPNPFVLHPDDAVTFRDSNDNICRYLYCSGKSQFDKFGKITLNSPSEDPYCIEYKELSGSDKMTSRIYFRNVPLIPQINET